MIEIWPHSILKQLLAVYREHKGLQIVDVSFIYDLDLNVDN